MEEGKHLFKNCTVIYLDVYMFGFCLKEALRCTNTESTVVTNKEVVCSVTVMLTRQTD